MSSFLLAVVLFNAWARPVDVCSDRELRRRDCRLRVEGYSLRLLKDTIAWNDGTWRTVDDMPLKGDDFEWEKASFEFLGGWPILQLWIWDKGQGEVAVQSLHWFVADAEKRRLTVLASGVVRKRRARSAAAGAGDKIVDAMEPHGLKVQKDGSLEWTLREKKIRLERTKHGI